MTPLRTWFRRGGVSTLLFALPLIVVFAVFSWSPIIQSFVMSFQETNLITPQWVGLHNFVNVLTDPLLGTAVVNTLYFAVLALIFGYPLPLLHAVLMSEVRRCKGVYSALAYLPVVIPPVVAVLLWKFFYDAWPTGVFNTILGWAGLPPVSWIQQDVRRHALTGARGDLGGGRRHDDHLPGCTDRRPARPVRRRRDRPRAIWRKIWHVTLPQLRGVLLHHADPADDRDGPGISRAVPLHRRRPEQRDHHDPAADLPLRVPNSLGGEYGEATALSVMLAIVLAVLSIVYFRLTERWSQS